jgi:AcrR family transcriptional regulator
MKPTKRRGRPSKTADIIDKAAILSCAKRIIEVDGIDALSFRSLAAKLGVTPMAVSYHVGSRDEMVADLLTQSFKDIDKVVSEGTPTQKLRTLLVNYCAVALEHAGLVQCMLNNPTLMPQSILLFGELVRQQTKKLNDGDEGDAMLNLVIDHLHGFAFSAIAAPLHIVLTTNDYE